MASTEIGLLDISERMQEQSSCKKNVLKNCWEYEYSQLAGFGCMLIMRHK